MNGRNISLLCHHRATIYESPCRVRVVVEIKLSSLSVFFEYEYSFKLGLLSPLRYLHTLSDIGSDVVRSEVEERQHIEAISYHCNDEDS